MSVTNQGKLIFKGVEITNVHFDSQQFYDGKSSINFDIVPKLFRDNIDKNDFKIIMSLNMTCPNFFDVRLNAIGGFTINDPENVLTEDQRNFFLNLNSPAIMFPYIRAFIATFTGNLGSLIPRINLPTQFFDGKIEEIEANQIQNTEE